MVRRLLSFWDVNFSRVNSLLNFQGVGVRKNMVFPLSFSTPENGPGWAPINDREMMPFGSSWVFLAPPIFRSQRFIEIVEYIVH